MLKGVIEIMSQNKPIIIAPKISNKNPNKTTKKCVCAYCRVSTDSEMQLNSYEAQVEYYEEYIKSKEEWEYVGIYPDEGISGTQIIKRREFNKMINDCKKGKIDLILCKSISRFGRNTTDILNNIRILKDLNVAVFFENENINTLEISGEILLTILAALAQDGSRQISENVRWGNDKAFKKGRVYGNNNILGYNIIEGNLVINEGQAKIVKYIYDLYLDGYGSVAIANKLTGENILSPTGKKEWNKTTILSILHNEKYAGHLLQQKYITTDYLSHKRLKNKGEERQYLFNNHHEPIIPIEQWNAVQLEIERRKKIQNVEIGRRTKHSNKYCWSGKLKCNNCKEGFRRTIWHKNKPYESVVWQCNGYSLKGKEYCNIGAIQEKLLEKIVIKVIKEIQNDKVILFDKFTNAIEEILEEPELKKDIINTEKKIIELNNEARDLRKMCAKGLITENEFQDDYIEIKEDINKTSNYLIKLKNKQLQYIDKNNRIMYIKKYLNEYISIEKFDENIVRKMIEKIIVINKTYFKLYLFNNLIYDVKKENDVFICTMQSVLLAQYKYDLRNLFSICNPHKEIYKEVIVEVYLNI